MSTRGFIRLRSCCRLQSGREGHAIFNLEGGSYAFIPPTIYALLTVHKHFTLSELEEFAGGTGKLEAYIDHLIASHFLLETRTPEHYPATSDEWECPELVLIAVLEVGPASPYDLWAVLDQLRTLNCKHVEIRLLDGVPSTVFEQVLEHTADGTYRTVDLVANWSTVATGLAEAALPAKLEQWLALYPKLNRFLLYNSPPLNPSTPWPTSVLRTSQPLAQLHAGEEAFRSDKLYISMPFYTESLRFNPFYNRKACVAADGAIKNCLDHAASFGNACTESIADVVNQTEFQRMWQQNNASDPHLADSVFKYARLTRVYA